MKKTISALLAATIALSAVGLCACGDGKTNTMTGLRSEKITTAAAWTAAFDFTAVTNGTVELRMTEAGVENYVTCGYFDGNKSRRSGIRNGEKWDRCYVVNGETVSIYTYDATKNEWAADGTIDAHALYTMDQMVDEIDDISEIKTHYADYSYNDALGAYVGFFDDPDGYYRKVNVTVKFKGGKVAECYATAVREGYAPEGDDTIEIPYTFKLTVYDLGGTKVTPPEVGA